MDILVVTEDPHFITAVHDLIGPEGGRVVGCLGPANSHCPLEQRHVCGMAEHSAVAIVDVPPSGSFGRPGSIDAVPAGEYAERLQAAHPGLKVLLCGAIPGASGPSGEVTLIADRLTTLATLQAILQARV